MKKEYNLSKMQKRRNPYASRLKKQVKHKNMRTQSRDTHPDIEKKIISLLREKTFSQKYAMVRSLTEMAIRNSKRALVRANPDLDENEIKFKFIELHYGKDLAEKVKLYQEKISA